MENVIKLKNTIEIIQYNLCQRNKVENVISISNGLQITTFGATWVNIQPKAELSFENGSTYYH